MYIYIYKQDKTNRMLYPIPKNFVIAHCIQGFIWFFVVLEVRCAPSLTFMNHISLTELVMLSVSTVKVPENGSSL